MTPIKGFAGTITYAGGSVAWIETWSAELETETVDIGPFINDNGTVYTFTRSQKLTGSLEGKVPNGKNAGQTSLISGALSGNTASLVLTTTGGYTITIPSAVVSNFSMEQDASESINISFDYESSGTFTVA